jgi:hypothetical protein
MKLAAVRRVRRVAATGNPEDKRRVPIRARLVLSPLAAGNRGQRALGSGSVCRHRLLPRRYDRNKRRIPDDRREVSHLRAVD